MTTTIESPLDAILEAEEQLRRCGATWDAIEAYSGAIENKNLADTEAVMRRIGGLLLEHDRSDLWQMAYQEFLAVMWPDDGHPAGDAMQFLYQRE